MEMSQICENQLKVELAFDLIYKCDKVEWSSSMDLIAMISSEGIIEVQMLFNSVIK